MQYTELSQQIQQQAEQCVKCGLCLPQCPTYQLTQNECESPRGRIAMMAGIAQEQLPLTDKLKTYLDHCLGCQSCERVCPAKVPYGNLLDNTRHLMNKKYNAPAEIPGWLRLALKHPQIMRYGWFLLRLYQTSGLQKLLRKTRLLQLMRLDKLDPFLPPLTKPALLQAYYPAKTKEQGQVALFLGCLNRGLDSSTLLAAIKVLTYYGYGVHIPAQQGCCGALHLHAGYPEIASRLKKNNQQVFNNSELSAIISVTSGCSAVLLQQNFSIPIFDISQFINQLAQPSQIEILALKKRVSVHIPCTLRNAVKQGSAPMELLKKIPDLEIMELTASNCCGAAGLYMLKFPGISAELLVPLQQQLAQQQTEYLATANIGCALHFMQALAKPLKILHPISLFAEQLAIKKQ